MHEVEAQFVGQDGTPELTEAAILKICEKALIEGQRISQAVGDNWYPCGFAYLRVNGRSKLARLLKKHPRSNNKYNQQYSIGILRGWKDDYYGGYTLVIDYPAKNATESQSLNFMTPLYQFVQRELALYGEVVDLDTRVD